MHRNISLQCDSCKLRVTKDDLEEAIKDISDYLVDPLLEKYPHSVYRLDGSMAIGITEHGYIVIDYFADIYSARISVCNRYPFNTEGLYERANLYFASENIVIKEPVKRCSRCGSYRRESAFGNYPRKKDFKLNYVCKSCRNKESEKARQEKLDAWKQYLITKFGKNIKCEICKKELGFFSGDSGISVHWDHKDGLITQIKMPSTFFASKFPTKENIELFEKEDFGMLCLTCNRKLPTDLEYRKNLKKYL